ncbi:hypothetical protein HPP92_009148 [Vanilla planifolia]|uniref:Uncharacterized protein n=1 Tax=Vanilla planifolia TaxID=51239 RepID=A0A835RIR2_VANPL|nr:hypothetical protein HPP92_009148 [Vanilla planifolia]
MKFLCYMGTEGPANIRFPTICDGPSCEQKRRSFNAVNTLVRWPWQLLRDGLSFLLFRSKSKSLENFVADPWSMRRSLSFCSSGSKPISGGKTARDSLEFVQWHNGGGLYHRTALIEHSVRIGIGAIVHEEAIVELT